MSAHTWLVVDCVSALLILGGLLTLAALSIRDAVRAWREGGGR